MPLAWPHPAERPCPDKQRAQGVCSVSALEFVGEEDLIDGRICMFHRQNVIRERKREVNTVTVSAETTWGRCKLVSDALESVESQQIGFLFIIELEQGQGQGKG